MSGTMLVYMMTQISGGRADGRPWPPPGPDHPLEVMIQEGEDLISAGLAVRVEHRDVPAAPHQDEAPEPVTVLAPEPSDPVLDDVPGPEAVAPSPSDVKQVWVDYAISQGTRSDEANGLTKDQLMKVYGKTS